MIRKFGREAIDEWKKNNELVEKYEKTIKKYESRAKRVNEIMVEWKKKSPNIYRELDNKKIDLYLGVDEYVDSGIVGEPFGATTGPKCVNGEYVYRSTVGDGRDALDVFVNSGVNISEIDEETGEYTLNHEAWGHWLFAVEHPDEYEEDVIKLGEDYDGGHHPDARTGKKAKDAGQILDIEDE